MSLKANILVTNRIKEKTIQFHVDCNESPVAIGYHLAKEAVNMKTNNPKYLARNLDAFYAREEKVNNHVDNDYLYVIDLSKRIISCYFCLMYGIGNNEVDEVINNLWAKASRLALVFRVPFGATKEEIMASVKTFKKKAERKYVLLVKMQEKEGFDGAIFEIDDFDKE